MTSKSYSRNDRIAEENQPRQTSGGSSYDFSEMNQSKHTNVIRETLYDVLKLLYAYQMNSNDAFTHKYNKSNSLDRNLNAEPNPSPLFDFCTRIFMLHKDEFPEIKKKLENSVKELESYIANSLVVSKEGTTYECLHRAASSITSSPFFTHYTPFRNFSTQQSLGSGTVELDDINEEDDDEILENGSSQKRKDKTRGQFHPLPIMTLTQSEIHSSIHGLDDSPMTPEKISPPDYDNKAAKGCRAMQILESIANFERNEGKCREDWLIENYEDYFTHDSINSIGDETPGPLDRSTTSFGSSSFESRMRTITGRRKRTRAKSVDAVRRAEMQTPMRRRLGTIVEVNESPLTRKKSRHRTEMKVIAPFGKFIQPITRSKSLPEIKVEKDDDF